MRELQGFTCHEMFHVYEHRSSIYLSRNISWTISFTCHETFRELQGLTCHEIIRNKKSMKLIIFGIKSMPHLKYFRHRNVARPHTDFSSFFFCFCLFFGGEGLHLHPQKGNTQQTFLDINEVKRHRGACVQQLITKSVSLICGMLCWIGSKQ